MKTLTIKDLSRDEEVDRKAMAELRGGQVYSTPVCVATYRAGMTEGEAIAQFVAFGTCLHDYQVVER
jgi:hypothetical protein